MNLICNPQIREKKGINRQYDQNEGNMGEQLNQNKKIVINVLSFVLVKLDVEFVLGRKPNIFLVQSLMVQYNKEINRKIRKN